jgi:hypothetical protein
LKSKHTSAIWSCNPTFRYIPKGMWLRLLQRHLHTHVYCCTINNSQVMETSKMPHYWLISKQWNSTQPWRRMKSYHLQVNGCNWRTSFWGRLARLKRPKFLCFPSYVDFRSRENTAMWLDLGHMIRGEHTWEVWRGVRNPKHDSIWCPHSRGNNAETLKWQRSIWEGNQ